MLYFAERKGSSEFLLLTHVMSPFLVVFSFLGQFCVYRRVVHHELMFDVWIPFHQFPDRLRNLRRL